ncbi:MAG: PH domain-containing protein [Verrucomicrobiota bacterium]
MPGALLFVVREYTLEPRELLIRRLLWTTHLPLSGLQSASYQPNAMRGSLRLFGNGGMFSVTGWYRNRSLGNYRAFVTEFKNTVVLRYEKKAVVISPDHPEQFVAEISRCAAQNS